MTKKLKIRFVKFEKVLAMQILEQEGEFEASTHVKLSYSEPWIESKYIYLIGKHVEFDKHVSTMRFNNNEERDAYLKKVVHWISEEQFAMRSGKLKVGELCEAHVGNRWEKRKLLAILPKRYKNRFIVERVEDDESWVGCSKVLHLPNWNKSTVDGDVYTWEG